jgi:ferredoxin-NADP reductase
MFIMVKAYSPEPRLHAIAVARKGEGPVSQIARDFRKSGPCLHTLPPAEDLVLLPHLPAPHQLLSLGLASYERGDSCGGDLGFTVGTD